MYALREALAAFRRAPLLTGLSAAMVGLALFVVGLFALAAYNLQLALESVEERVEIVAYLREEARTDEIALAEQELSSLPEVESVEIVTKDEALEIARRELPEFREVFTDLDVNPLPASIEIRLKAGHRDPSSVDHVARQAGQYPIVEDVRFGREWVDKVFTIRRMAAITTAVMGIAFALVALLIIGTAVRMAVFARRDEIRIMRLVGARDRFIRLPFLLEGALTGFAGGVLAIALTWLTYRAVFHWVFSIEWIPLSWVGAGLLAGVLFGTFASSLAVRRYLREVGE
ncbi:MAG: ABC transporter permease [Gemmatimonadetes bacterium]|nr:MAG: ABC transporter permease [Gemmatimonadota bacterium]